MFVEDVDLAVLYERDGGLCGFCGGDVVPVGTDGEMQASIDHTISLNSGGLHSYANTRLAHALCNAIAGAADAA